MPSRTLPANKRGFAQNRFAWTVPGTRRKIDIPAAASLTLRQVRDMQTRKTTSVDDLLDLADTDAAREAILDLEIGQLKDFFRDWAQAGTTTAGKS